MKMSAPTAASCADEVEAAIEAELERSSLDLATDARRDLRSSSSRRSRPTPPTLDAYVAHLLGALDGPHARRAARRARLRERRGVRSSGRACSRAAGARVDVLTPSPTAATSTTAADRRIPSCCSARCVERGADARSRARRRRRPGARGRRARRARRRRPDHGDDRARLARARDAAQRRDRGDRDVEPRAAARAAPAPASASSRRRSATGTSTAAMADARSRDRRRAVGSHRVRRPRDDRRRRAHRSDRRRPRRARAASPLSALAARDDPAAAGARERAGRAPASTSSVAAGAARRCAAVEAELGDRGRVLVRSSGTEPRRAGDGRGADARPRPRRPPARVRAALEAR